MYLTLCYLYIFIHSNRSLSILFFTGFIESGNIILLLCCMSFFYLMLFCSAIMVTPHKTYGKLANTT
ncbi:hypothetical protein [Salipaludibacillus agaradhaerens]|uniref:hypothetical protein n=1 Tax=Salipaludibacillus agaradhaerens TaxID=76935 RepID=UPI003B84775F